VTYRFPDTALLIFCKAPVAGQVKTRLSPRLNPGQCAETHRQLAAMTLRMATVQPVCPIQLWCSPDTGHPFFSHLARTFPLTLHRQQGADLGARMFFAVSTALMAYRHALVIGTDCPSLKPVTLQEACEALKNNDLVLAPAEDGGYVLIGCNAPQPGLFVDMPWGTSKVLALTRERIRQYQLSCHELATFWDVDTFEDYCRWRTMAYPGGELK